MIPKLFSELGLSPEILKGIDKLGFEQAAPIQAAAIPVLMSGKDVVGQSQTGSGKTAAFAIPAIEKTDPRERCVQILILCPTRELAVQVAEEVHKLSFFKRGIQALPIYGGQSYDRQLIGLRQGAQIVIGTPGRVMDHMDRGTLRLDNLKMLILDEADVMLNMGFRDDIETILKSTPPTRQTVFFSATMPRPIRDLIERHSKTPENVRVDQQAMTVPTVEQIYFEVDRRWKIEVLTRLIDVHDLKLVIIFCNTKRMVDELVEHLNTQGYSAEGLHGDMNQAQRDRVMNKFRKSGLEFLVATDVAARGIDVDDIQAVFNYDLPYDVEDYVHRIGRTGRAGRSGMAFSFVAGRELFQIRNIERFTRMRIQRGRVPSVEEVDEARANVLLDKVRTTLQVGKFNRQDHAVERLLEEGFDSTDIISAMLHLLEGGSPGELEKAPKIAAAPRPAPGVESGVRSQESGVRSQESGVRTGVASRPAGPAVRPEAPPVRPVALAPIAQTPKPAALARPKTLPPPSGPTAPFTKPQPAPRPQPVAEAKIEAESPLPPTAPAPSQPIPAHFEAVSALTPSSKSQNVSSEQPSQPSELPETPPKQTESRSFHTEERSFQAEPRSFHTESRSFQAEPRSFHTESRSFQAEPRSFHTESRSFQTEERSFQTEPRSFQAEERCEQAESGQKQTELPSEQAGSPSNQAEQPQIQPATPHPHVEPAKLRSPKPAYRPQEALPTPPAPDSAESPASAEQKVAELHPEVPLSDLDSKPSTAADLRKLINQPRKPGPPKKELRTALDRPAARQPVRRDYDEHEDQPQGRPRREEFAAGPAPAPRRPAPSRATPPEMARLWMSVGERHGVVPGDIVGCILGETGLPSGTVGVVDIRERHTFVDVKTEAANGIISKLKRTAIRGHRLKVKLA